MPAIALPSESAGRLRRIFRADLGHLPDTPENRALLVEVANDAAVFRGTDRYGNAWYGRNRSDGSQIWVKTRAGQIVNGGVNAQPRNFAPSSGLALLRPRREDR